MSHSGAFYQPIHSLRTSTLTHWTIRLIVELSSSQWMYSLFEYHCQVSVSLSSICISIIVKYLYQYHCQVSVSVSLSSICISITVKYLYQYHCQVSVSVSLSSICISIIVKYLYQYHCQSLISRCYKTMYLYSPTWMWHECYSNGITKLSNWSIVICHPIYMLIWSNTKGGGTKFGQCTKPQIINFRVID